MKPKPIDKTYLPVITKATDFKVVTKTDYEHGRDILKTLSDAAKKAKEQKDKVLKPLLEAVNARREEWRPIEDKLKACIDSVKEQMAGFLLAENIREEKERLKIANDNRIKNPETLERKLAAIESAPTGGSRKILVLKITNPALIPREYLDINEIRLRADLKEGKIIPGAELVREQIIAVR